MDRARTLWVAVWLHWLDMAITGDGMASETLEASQHHQGPLLESFLTPSMSNLSFREVVDCILQENWRASERLLNYLPPFQLAPSPLWKTDLLTGGGVIGVELDLAHLMVSSPRSPNGEGKEASA